MSNLSQKNSSSEQLVVINHAPLTTPSSVQRLRWISWICVLLAVISCPLLTPLIFTPKLIASAIGISKGNAVLLRVFGFPLFALVLSITLLISNRRKMFIPPTGVGMIRLAFGLSIFWITLAALLFIVATNLPRQD